jgi:hypothetical protein
MESLTVSESGVFEVLKLTEWVTAEVSGGSFGDRLYASSSF